MASYQKMICVAAVFLTFILFSGCIFPQTEEPNVQRTEGLSISFEPNSPPDSIRADDLFNIHITIPNRGNYEVKKGELTLKLFGGNYDFSGKEWTNKEPIRAAFENEEFGGIAYVEDFEGASFTGLPVPGTEIPFTIGASMCYTYETDAFARICTLSDAGDASACSDAGEKLKKVSVAPITVTSVTQQSYPTSTDIFIQVKNMKNNRVYSQDSDCADRKEEDVITLKKFEIDGTDYLDDCDTEVRLSGADGSATFVCKVPKAVSSTIEQTASITLAYRYTDKITKVVYVSA